MMRAPTRLPGHYAALFFDLAAPGQIGPQDRKYVIYAPSLAAAKRAATRLKTQNHHARLVDVHPIPAGERGSYERQGWYANEIRESEEPDDG